MAEAAVRKAIVVAPEDGRTYDMGRMRAVFKADQEETASRYSVSEWWLEPGTRGPGIHQHEEDHVFYVLAGTLSACVNDHWTDLPKGGCVVIPGDTPHDFENRGAERCGFISFTTPGGFEEWMPAIAEEMRSEDLRL